MRCTRCNNSLYLNADREPECMYCGAIYHSGKLPSLDHPENFGRGPARKWGQGRRTHAEAALVDASARRFLS